MPRYQRETWPFWYRLPTNDLFKLFKTWPKNQRTPRRHLYEGKVILAKSDTEKAKCYQRPKIVLKDVCQCKNSISVELELRLTKKNYYHAWLQGPTWHATLRGQQGSATENPPDRWSERTGLLEAAVAGTHKSIGRLEKRCYYREYCQTGFKVDLLF